MIGNHFYPQQKLVSKVRDGAKITKKYDTAKTPYARVSAHLEVKALPKRRLATQHTSFNPAAVQRQIQAFCDELLTLATAKGQPARKPPVSAPATRTFSGQFSRPLPGPPWGVENGVGLARVHAVSSLMRSARGFSLAWSRRVRDRGLLP